MSASSFTAVDLSRLIAPTLIETISYETILAELTADLQSRWAVHSPSDPLVLLDTDPAMIVLQTVAYRITIERQRINDAAKGVMIAYALGTDLDNLAAVFGVTRLTDETDDALRERVILAPESYSVAGPEGAYTYWARSADPTIMDAKATSPTPGDVVVSLLSSIADGTADDDQIDAVEAIVATVAGNAVRPLTDNVTVQSAEIVSYTVAAALTLFAGPDPTVVLATSQAALADYIARAKRIGRDITRAGLLGALVVEGVQNVTLTLPAADLVISDTQAAHCAGSTVTVAGYGS